MIKTLVLLSGGKFNKITLAIAALASIATSNSAFAQTPGERIISTRKVTLSVEINPKMLHFSRADYSQPVVKVLVPDLADVTLLNHRNTFEGAPCLASYQAKTPEDVIQNRPGVEQIEFVITLKKTVYPDVATKTCQVELTEEINGNIRGFAFVHSRTAEMPVRNINDCR